MEHKNIMSNYAKSILAVARFSSRLHTSASEYHDPHLPEKQMCQEAAASSDP